MKNSDEISASSIRHYFRIDIILLQLMGLSSFEFVFSGGKFESRWWNCFFIYITISMIISVIICQLNTIFFIKIGLNSSVEVLSLLIVYIVAVVKGARWWTYRRQIYNILQELSTQWNTARTQNFLSIENVKAAENARDMRTVYLVTLGFVFVAYEFRPYIMYLNYRLQGNTNDSFSYHTTTVIPVAYPIAIDSFQRFCAVVTYEQIVVFAACMYWASSDSFFIQLTSHISIQFMVLAQRLENIVADDENSNHDDYIRQQLQSIAKQHHQLLRYCELSENIYDPIVFLIVISNGISLCASLYVLEDQVTSSEWSQVATSMTNLVCLFIETVIYCNYADHLTQSSTKVCHAAYSSQWVNWSQRNKRTLFIIMMRAAKEYQFTAYHMIIVNLKQITAITNGAVSYFMLLKRFK